MRKNLFVIGIMGAALSLWAAANATQYWPKMVGEEGSRVRMLIMGQKGPVVVLDTFGAAPLEFWGNIQARCAKFCRVVAYDHRDTWGSDAGPKPRDARAIATELHEALRNARLEPPYYLVGFSFGGP